MDRILIVPAAGRGTRLGVRGPKALTPVAGRPMLDHLIAMHRSTVDRLVVVVAPDAREVFEAFAASCGVLTDLAEQTAPTGMLDAIIAAAPAIETHRPRRVAVTWCDQIAVSPATIHRVRDRAVAPDAPALVLPTLAVDRPYIHFERDRAGRITAVRQRREGDAMPERGETDLGLFDLSIDAYLSDLPAFARGAAAARGTGERNFLPFIPWLAARRTVETVPGASPLEAVGINTPADLARVEAHLTGQPHQR